MPDVENFSTSGDTSPAANAEAITPNDSADIPNDRFTRAIYVGVAGNLAVVMADDIGDTNPVVFVDVQAGTLLPIRVKRVRVTDTTALSIVALF